MIRSLFVATAVLVLSGCAVTTRPTVAPGSVAAIGEWTALSTLSLNSRIRVTLNSGSTIDGRFIDVDENRLRLATSAVALVDTVPRPDVTRVSRIDSMARHNAKQGAIAGSILGGLIVFLSGGGLWPALVVDPAALSAIGAAIGSRDRRLVLIYERPG